MNTCTTRFIWFDAMGCSGEGKGPLLTEGYELTTGPRHEEMLLYTQCSKFATLPLVIRPKTS